IIRKEVSVLCGVRVCIAIVANAIADVEQAAVRKRDRYTRREVSQPVLAAEPIRDDAGFGVNRLLVTQDDSGSRLAHESCRCISRVLIRTKNTVWASGKAGTVVAGFHFFADFGVDIAPAVLSLTLVERSVPKNARSKRHARIIVVVILHLKVRLDVTEVVR